MEQLLGLQTWGTDLILWVQSWGSSFLDGFFRAITWLGNLEAYLVIVPFLYWCVNRQWGQRLLFLVVVSTWINEILKNLLALPRPDPNTVRWVVEQEGYGFPSNHAQTGAVIVWGYLAAKVRRWWFTLLAVAIIVLLGLSRAYLGVHFPQDVMGGWLLGLVLLALALRYETRIVAWWHGFSTRGQVAATVALPVLVLFTVPRDVATHYPTESATILSGILLGAGLGTILEARLVRFRVEGSIGRRLLRYVVGMLVVGVVYVPDLLLPEWEPWLLEVVVSILLYGLVGLATIWLAPWLFVKMRLAESDLVPQHSGE